MHVLLVEEPTDELLEEWAVDVLPTWLRFDPLTDDALGTGGSGGAHGSDSSSGAHSSRGSRSPHGPSTSHGTDADEEHGELEELILDVLRGADPEGAERTLPGPWRLTKRRTGARPKHVVDAEFGPGD